MFRRIGNVALKEIIQLTRNWLLLIFLVLGPTMELVLLARATGQGLKHLAIVVVDQDRSQASRQIASALDNTEELDVVAYLDSLDQVDAWMERKQVILAVILPPGLEVDQATGSPQVQLIADGTNNMASASAVEAALGAISTRSVAIRSMASYASLSNGGPAIALRTQVLYNPALDGNYSTIPAQLGFVVYQVVLMVAAVGLTRERELGTLEQLLVTPLRRLELIIGKAIPALLVGCVDLVLMWAITVWGFAVPMRGSFLLLVGLSLLFIAAEIGWGLTISGLAQNQQQAGLVIFVLALIDVSFSGYVMPVEYMPATLQIVSKIFPLQHYLEVIRGIMLKGATLQALWSPALTLAALSVGSLAVAVISLRSRLE
jgi:ABC-2 type transport system permease protein